MKLVKTGVAVLSLFIPILLGLHCSPTNSKEIEFTQGNTKATVIVHILDAHTNAPIKDVLVKIAGYDSAQTDSTGLAVIKNIVPGSFILFCMKTGYESIASLFEVAIDSNSTTVPIVKQSAERFYLAHQGVTIQGNVYYEDERAKIPAESAVVECRLGTASNNFLDPLRKAVVTNGIYTFSDLPEFTSYAISILPYKVNKKIFKQQASISISGKAVGDTAQATPAVLTLTPDDYFIVLSHNLKNVMVNDSIVILFSDAVDTNIVNADSIYVLRNSTKILIKRKWAVNNTRLIIRPFDGKWMAQYTYLLYVKRLKSSSGKTLVNTEFNPYSFYPVLTGTLGNIQNLKARANPNADSIKIDYNTSSVYLLWSPLSNAISYEVYKKAFNDSVWSLVNEISDTVLSIASAGVFANGGFIKFLVLGSNSTMTSPIESASVITAKDEKQPVINTVSSSSGFNNSSIATPKLVTISAYLPEPMDTSTKPAFSVIEASYVSGSTMFGDTAYKVPADKCVWTWTSTTGGRIDVTIDASMNGAYDTLKVNCRGLKDSAGNPVDSTNNRGFAKYMLFN